MTDTNTLDDIHRAIFHYADARVMAVHGRATKVEVNEAWGELQTALTSRIHPAASEAGAVPIYQVKPAKDAGWSDCGEERYAHIGKVMEDVPNVWQRRIVYAAPPSAPAAEPLFWYRPCSDGSYEGPLHDRHIEEVRKRSGAWVPLFPGAPAAESAETEGTDDERCGAVTLRGELLFRHEHDLHNTPNYAGSLLCRRTEAALAQPTAATADAQLSGNSGELDAQGCATDVCQAAQRDGVLCANDECDIASGVRKANAQGDGPATVWYPDEFVTDLREERDRLLELLRRSELSRQPSAAAMRDALFWYAVQVEGCRKIGLGGDASRQRLDEDGGQRARAALAAAKPGDA